MAHIRASASRVYCMRARLVPTTHGIAESAPTNHPLPDEVGPLEGAAAARPWLGWRNMMSRCKWMNRTGVTSLSLASLPQG